MHFNLIGPGVVLALSLAAFSLAETHSQQVDFESDKWIEVGVESEGVDITEIRFSLEGGINFNPLRAGKGPQCIVSLRNNSRLELDLAVGLAVFDADGNLLGATESGTPSLDPGEEKEITMTFREVKRKLYNAKTVHIVLETFR